MVALVGFAATQPCSALCAPNPPYLGVPRKNVSGLGCYPGSYCKKMEIKEKYEK